MPQPGSEESSRVFLPIWSCSVWGLPCPLHCCRGGALLPHLFTLTPAFPPGRYIFCGTFRRMEFDSTLPDVIRHTALRSSDFPPLSLTDKSDRPAQLPTNSLYSSGRAKFLPLSACVSPPSSQRTQRTAKAKPCHPELILARDLTNARTEHTANRINIPVDC